MSQGSEDEIFKKVGFFNCGKSMFRGFIQKKEGFQFSQVFRVQWTHLLSRKERDLMDLVFQNMDKARKFVL